MEDLGPISKRTVNDIQTDGEVTSRTMAREVISRCKRKGILASYLNEYGEDVEDILSREFDQERAMELYLRDFGNEKRAEERTDIVKKVMRSQDYSAEDAMDFLEIKGEDREDVLRLLKEDR